MLPRNSMEFIDEIAQKTGYEKQLVQDAVRFFYESLRKSLSNFDDVTISVIQLGTFSTNRNKLKKQKKEILKRYIKANKMLFANDVRIINDAIEKNDKIMIDYYENKLAKLKWHKENGDPYKKYSLEQEEDCKRVIKFLNKEIEDRRYVLEENETLQDV